MYPMCLRSVLVSVPASLPCCGLTDTTRIHTNAEKGTSIRCIVALMSHMGDHKLASRICQL